VLPLRLPEQLIFRSERGVPLHDVWLLDRGLRVCSSARNTLPSGAPFRRAAIRRRYGRTDFLLKNDEDAYLKISCRVAAAAKFPARAGPEPSAADIRFDWDGPPHSITQTAAIC